MAKAQPNKPLVAVVIVTWNSSQDILDCLQTVTNQDYSNYQVIVVDNNSADGTAEIVQASYPQVILIRKTQNLFFAGGNNAGINYAMRQLAPVYVAVLNPDTLVEPNWISSQVDLLESDPGVGIVGPKVVFAEGFGPNTRKLSTADKKYINTVGIHPGGKLMPYDLGFGELDNGQFDHTQAVFGVSGVSMLMRTKMLQQVGLFYAPMQMYLEDVDLCVRATKAGWQILYTSATTVQHKHMHSTKQSGFERYLFWSRRNYIVYVWRHYPKKKFLRAMWEVAKEMRLKSIKPITSALWMVLTAQDPRFNLA